MATPERPTFLLIHGANSTGAELAPLTRLLEPHGRVLAPNLIGHGGRPLPDRFWIQDWAEDLLQYMDAEKVRKPILVGYSIGGVIALWLARHHGAKLRGVCAIAPKTVWDENTVKHFTHLCDPERIARPENPRGQVVPALHLPNDWKDVVKKLAQLWPALGRAPALTDEDFAAITVPVLLMSGTTDQLVRWDEILALAQKMPKVEVGSIEGYAHPLQTMPLKGVVKLLLDWTGRLP